MVTLPFSLVSAFTTDPYAGNPAAVVLLDPSSPLEFQVLGKISKNFNQPMTTIVSVDPLPSDDPKIIARGIRFLLANGQERRICGHGTLTAAKVLFNESEVAASGIQTIHFYNTIGTVLTARKLEDGFIEISLPSSIPGNVSDEEKANLAGFVNRAFGREVKIKAIKTGGDVYDDREIQQIFLTVAQCLTEDQVLLVELDESEMLGESAVDADALIGNGYEINVFTTASNTEEVFISRMFAPTVLIDKEDSVCGSAHGVLTPFWCEKRGIAPGKEVKARQVSPRGGDLKVVWEPQEGVVKLRGQAIIYATGNLLV